jgi:hypothetical protein
VDGKRPEGGKCPDCGRVVPVPDSAWQDAVTSNGHGGGGDDAESRTQDLTADDLQRLEEWAKKFVDRPQPQPANAASAAPGSSSGPTSPPPSSPGVATTAPPSSFPKEVGLRVCSRCGKPLHMSATVCRSCGEPAPKR